MDSIANLTVRVIILAQLFTVVCFVQGIPRFTREPPSVLFVSSGGTARLVWDYNVENRTELFDPYSPEWSLYNTSGSKVRIALDDGFNKWKFVIHKDCPTGLRGRVCKDSTATLVIHNVTTADSGIYGCDLVLLSGSPIRSKVQLIITERPRFNITFNSSTPIIEWSPLLVKCSASAIPMPNVTWVRIMEKPTFISAGVGQAFLRFRTITRNQSGSYECQATNNPNEDSVTMRTEISVKFVVEPANVSVTNIQANSALIKWLRPIDYGGSPIVEYKIQISTIPPREIIITNTTYYFVQDLLENTTYSVEVYARNEAGYGKAVCAEFTTNGGKMQVSAVKLMVVKKGVPRVKMFAGVIGVIIWMGIMCTVILFLFIKKSCTGRGKKQADVSKQDIPSRDVSQEKEDQPFEDLPVYAQVDKSKKRRPGEIVYVELEQLNTNEDVSIVNEHHLPPRYHETQYADIKH